MLHVIKYAESVFKNNKKAWNEMMVRDMNKDFSWEASARRYEALYDRLTEK